MPIVALSKVGKLSDPVITDIRSLIDKASSSPDEVGSDILASEIWEVAKARFALGIKTWQDRMKADLAIAMKAHEERRQKRRDTTDTQSDDPLAECNARLNKMMEKANGRIKGNA